MSPLNPGFRAGVMRLKLMLSIKAGDLHGTAGDFVDVLTGFLPSLSFHRCCGDNSLRHTFFERDQRRSCAMNDSDAGVDLAHLIEHVLIDIQHYIGRMKLCSGITCALNHPRDQYDIFVECPEAPLGRACAAIAVDLIADLLDGRAPDPRYLCMIQVARAARDDAGWPVMARLAPMEMTWGLDLVDDAVEALARIGFLQPASVSFNFSDQPLLSYLPESQSCSMAGSTASPPLMPAHLSSREER